MPVGGDAVQQAGATAGAAQRTSEVVLAPIGPFAGLPMRRQHGLHLRERLGVDQLRVLALVLHTPRQVTTPM